MWQDSISSGSAIGVIGGGQLGQMLLLEARKNGFRTAVYTDEPPGCPAAQVADSAWHAPYERGRALTEFAAAVDAATVEFENIPADFIEALAELKPVEPNGQALAICQNREREKEFLRAHGIPCAPFRVIDSAQELGRSTQLLGYPCVLKTAAFGYDGKGQLKLEELADWDKTWADFGAERAVLEGWIPHVKELSVVAARGKDGDFAPFPVCENEHANHILDLTLRPARISPELAAQAQTLTRKSAEALHYIGTLCVEFFLTREGTLLVNEIAPRPHNSGHLTLDVCLSSQFAQQWRAVGGQPLGSTEMLAPAAAMVNLLGDLWPEPTRQPDWTPIWKNPRARLHLYGKAEARPGRKMGHFTLLGTSADALAEEARALQSALQSQVGV